MSDYTKLTVGLLVIGSLLFTAIILTAPLWITARLLSPRFRRWSTKTFGPP